MIEKIYYINLDERTDRRIKIEKEFSKSLIIKDLVERYSAIDGKKVHPKYVGQGILSKRGIQDILSENVKSWGLSLTQGALGTILTYLELFKKISSFSGYCITFEDDIKILDDFDDKLQKILFELPKNFDLCYLGHCDTKFEKIKYSENLSIPKGQLCCLPGLIISPKGAIKLQSILKNIDSQIDTVFYMNFDKLNVFVANEPIVKASDSSDSNIQGNKNNIKNYDVQNTIFATISVGDRYNELSLRLALDLKFFNQKILIVTDKPEQFNKINNVITIPYKKEKFSYNDKIICFKEGFKISDCVLYLDCDSRILYETFQDTFTDFLTLVPPGFHPSFAWGLVSREDGGFFKSTDISYRVKGYGEYAFNICKNRHLDWENAQHWQEGFLIISKEGGKEQKFLEVWESLKNPLDDFEISNKSKKIGVGEGNLIGIAISTAKMTIHNSDICNLFGEHVKYNADGQRMMNYLERYPKKKKVDFSELDLIMVKKIDVEFENKKIDLEINISDSKEGYYILNYEWNKNNNIQFLDHEFVIDDKTYHFNSDKQGSFIFKKNNSLEIYHTYDWFGNKNLKKIVG